MRQTAPTCHLPNQGTTLCPEHELLCALRLLFWWGGADQATTRFLVWRAVAREDESDDAKIPGKLDDMPARR